MIVIAFLAVLRFLVRLSPVLGDTCLIPYKCEVGLTYEQSVSISSRDKRHWDKTRRQCLSQLSTGIYHSLVYCQQDQFCGGNLDATYLRTNTGTES